MTIDQYDDTARSGDVPLPGAGHYQEAVERERQRDFNLVLGWCVGLVVLGVGGGLLLAWLVAR